MPSMPSGQPSRSHSHGRHRLLDAVAVPLQGRKRPELCAEWPMLDLLPALWVNYPVSKYSFPKIFARLPRLISSMIRKYGVDGGSGAGLCASFEAGTRAGGHSMAAMDSRLVPRLIAWVANVWRS